MQLQNRKSNRLQNYDYSTAGAYFITICTKNKAKILCEIVGGGAPSSTPSRVGAGVPSSTHYRVGGGALDAPQIILLPLGMTVEKYILSSDRIKGISVSKYVIMPNHIHLLVCIDGTNVGTSGAPSPTNHAIPRMVSALKRLVNRQVGQNIFQRSYYDHVIRDEADYLEKWNYIDTNPARWLQGKDEYQKKIANFFTNILHILRFCITIYNCQGIGK